jgi:hypothetical protein
VGTSFSVSVLFDEPVARFAPADVTIGGTSNAATPWSIDVVYGEGVKWNFTVHRTDQKPADGTLTIQLAAGMTHDLAGVPSGPSNVISRVIDHSGPTVTAPRTSLRSGTTLSGSSLRVRLNWTGTDVGPAGMSSYEIWRSYDGAAFASIGTSTSPQFDSTMTPGHTYQFRVRGRDTFGNVGAWATGVLLRPALTQQTSTTVHWGGTSVTTTSSSYSGGSERYLKYAGAYAYYTTTARSLSFVTTRGPGRGTAKIYIDNVLAATVYLNASTYTYRYIAFSKTWTSGGTHSIKVVSTGTPTGRVDIDAFGVIR